MNKEISSRIVSYTLAGYPIFLMIMLLILNRLHDSALLQESAFLHWDAAHYHFIRENGYEGFRIAFFPLFPMLWKVSQLGVYGAAVFNGLIFLFSFYGLAKLFKFNLTETLLYLSIPGSIFFYLPYSESVFFASSVLIIAGLRNNELKWVLTGLFLATLTRPAFTIFLPALIIVEYIFNSWKIAVRNILSYGLVIICGLFIVGYLQYLDTGEWFQFFSVQKQWGNFLQVPKLPLTSWAGDFIVRLDGIAFLTGIISGILLTGYLLKLKWLRNIPFPKEVIFSLAYLGGITLSVLLFRGGSLFSLNRFVFATAFIIVILHYWLKQPVSLKNKQLALILFSITVFWLLFGSWLHIHSFIMYMLISLYAVLVFSLKSENRKISIFSIIALVVLNTGFQLYLFFRFLDGEWVG